MRNRRVEDKDFPNHRPMQVLLEDITEQRAKGWPDFSPEEYCHRCGNSNELTWATPPEVWNPVMRGGDPAGWGEWQEIICIPCFIELAQPHSPEDAWTLKRDENGTVWLYRASDRRRGGE